jgi:Mrp family chromosome partitioning ATPase
VIAIAARATSPDFAARLANAVGEAQIAADLAARAEILREARALVDDQAGAARQTVLALTATLDNQVGSASPEEQTKLLAARQNLALARGQYHRLLQRSAELSGQAGLQMPDARLAAPASPPAEAGFPDIKTTMAVAALFGLALGLALAFTVDGLASGVRSTAELAEAIGVPMAVAMPRVNMLRFDGTSHADQVVTAPLSPFSEGMRTLQVNLQRNLALGAGGQVIFVLSPGDGEGKTTTALGLARAFDATGRTVLLLDADVRSAALHRHVDVPLAGGFEQVLAGEVDIGRLAGMVRRDPLSRLSVLVNSDRSAIPAEVLFGSQTFASVLRSLRATYAVTVVDMPSLRWSAEAAYILPHADAVVVVASWGRTERDKLREALAAIRQAHPVPVPLVPVLSLQPGKIRWPTPRYEPGYSAR